MKMGKYSCDDLICGQPASLCTLRAMIRSYPFMPAAILASICLAAPALVVGQENALTQIKEQELQDVRKQISDLKKSMDRRASERDRISGQLQESEGEIAEKRNTLRDLERQQAFSEKKKRELDDELTAKAADLGNETDQLAAQVQAAYTSGEQERIKLMLNQHDPATLGRLLTYYRYMSEFRGDNINAVNNAIDELTNLRKEAAEEENRIAGLARAHVAELARLTEAQNERETLLTSLRTKIANDGSEIERLAAQEEDLTRLIAELASILSDYPITSEEQFSKFKGRLTWPIRGTLIRDFGQPRADGRLKWNGVVLAAPRGQEVRSIYHGRVIFADWLSGMGLLVIVDHGESYMSLYGYNEATLKTAGDWVAPGDVIATVGDSGGQANSGLYFEIRRGSTPQNPRTWVSRQPNRP